MPAGIGYGKKAGRAKMSGMMEAGKPANPFAKVTNGVMGHNGTGGRRPNPTPREMKRRMMSGRGM